MPRTCRVCAHPEREAIDRLLMQGTSLRDIEGQFDVSRSSLSRHRTEHLPASRLSAEIDRFNDRRARLFRDASSVRRALESWSEVETEADWLAEIEQSEDEYDSGRFLLNKLGAERVLDRKETATLLILRSRIIAEYELQSTAELMLLDVAIINYRHILRINEWIGNLALLIEHDMFMDRGPTMKVMERLPIASGVKVEDELDQLRRELMPAVERANRQFIASMKALRDFRRASAVNVVVGSADQVNVADQQLAVRDLHLH